MNQSQPPKILAEKQLPTGKMMFVLFPGDKKPKWIWQNKLPKEIVSAWVNHLTR